MVHGDANDGAPTVVIDCEHGRRLGCATFCCRLIVRLSPGDRPAFDARGNRKSCVDKDPTTGLCVHLDSGSFRCAIWSSRPGVCRGYDCNTDPLLPIVLRDGFVSLTKLVRARPPSGRPVPEIPRIDSDEG